MRREGDAYKLDLMATEMLWSRNWSLSGGPSRTFPGFLGPLDPDLENAATPVP